jgi:hypothetical protein
MDVVGRDIRQLVINHMREFRNVETPCSDVCRYKDLNPVFFEVLKGSSPCGLALVAMDDADLKAIALQLLSQTVGAVFGPGKDQRLSPKSSRDQVDQKGLLVILLHNVGLLLHAFCRRIPGCNFDALGVLKKRGRKFPDVF